jgi:hypothetical protein
MILHHWLLLQAYPVSSSALADDPATRGEAVIASLGHGVLDARLRGHDVGGLIQNDRDAL